MANIHSIKNILEFNHLLSEKKNDILVVKLYTPWCSKCKVLDTKIREDVLSYEVYTIDIDSSAFIDDPMFESISSLPCIWVYKNNRKIEINSADLCFIDAQIKKFAVSHNNLN